MNILIWGVLSEETGAYSSSYGPLILHRARYYMELDLIDL